MENESPDPTNAPPAERVFFDKIYQREQKGLFSFLFKSGPKPFQIKVSRDGIEFTTTVGRREERAAPWSDIAAIGKGKASQMEGKDGIYILKLHSFESMSLRQRRDRAISNFLIVDAIDRESFEKAVIDASGRPDIFQEFEHPSEWMEES